MDALMDDERSSKLVVPMNKQRRHIPVHIGDIDDAISPKCDRERRELNALQMHEFTVNKKNSATRPPVCVR